MYNLVLTVVTRDEVSDGKLEREIYEGIVALTGLKVVISTQSRDRFHI